MTGQGTAAAMTRTAHRRSGGASRPPVVVSVVWLAIAVIAMAVPSALARYGPLEQQTTSALSGPSAAHWLGTDELGRDLLARIVYGAWPTFSGVLIAVVVAIGVGVPAGLAGGYLAGQLDRVLSVIADILMSVPIILVLLAAFAIFPNNVYVIMALFGFSASAAIYRIVRGATMTVAGELYVTAARQAGLSDIQIIRRHLAPRLAPLLRVQTSVIASIALVTEVGLGFLSLDVAPPTPSWGSLIADASQNLANDPWMLVPPVVVVAVTVLALGVLGDVGQQVARRQHRHGAAAGRSSRLPVRVAAGDTAERARPTRTPAPDGDVLLRVDGLSVRTLDPAPVTLVDDVHFDVRRGEVVGLVGESGAGKSVTARALTRLDDLLAVTGSVRFDGQELLNLSDRELHRYRGQRIAFIGQDPMTSLDPLFRIQSQLIEALRNTRRLSRAQAREHALGLLEAVRIKDPAAVARKYPFEVSGGMAQRVTIALALAGDPDLLIADEPTTALDVTVQMEVLGLLKSLQRERGLAILLVTHDWGVVADICDRAITMYAGEVVETGRVEDVFSVPSHPYTASLRLSDPHLQQVGKSLRSIAGTVPIPGSWPECCRFADRCFMAADGCRTLHPPLVQLDGPARMSRCLRARELREGLAHV